jgi:hypothetical protein
MFERFRFAILPILAAALGIVFAPPSNAAAQLHCYYCEDNVCTSTTENWGAIDGCGGGWQCHEGSCWLLCYPQGEVCGPQALTMSGQVVLPVNSDDSLLEYDIEAEVYRRVCDRAIVVTRGTIRPEDRARPLARIVVG